MQNDPVLGGIDSILQSLAPEHLQMLGQVQQALYGLEPDELSEMSEALDAAQTNEETRAELENALDMEVPPPVVLLLNALIKDILPQTVNAPARAGLMGGGIASLGRHGDTMLAHITPQEAQLLQRRGGSGSINPNTGYPEFFLKKLGRGLKKAFKKVKPFLPMLLAVAAPFAAAAWAPALYAAVGSAGTAALGSGVGTMLAGGSLKDGFKAAAFTYAGAAVAGGVSSSLQGGSFTQGLQGATGTVFGGASPSLAGAAPSAGGPPASATPITDRFAALDGAATAGPMSTAGSTPAGSATAPKSIMSRVGDALNPKTSFTGQPVLNPETAFAKASADLGATASQADKLNYAKMLLEGNPSLLTRAAPLAAAGVGLAAATGGFDSKPPSLQEADPEAGFPGWSGVYSDWLQRDYMTPPSLRVQRQAGGVASAQKKSSEFVVPSAGRMPFAAGGNPFASAEKQLADAMAAANEHRAKQPPITLGSVSPASGEAYGSTWQTPAWYAWLKQQNVLQYKSYDSRTALYDLYDKAQDLSGANTTFVKEWENKKRADERAEAAAAERQRQVAEAAERQRVEAEAAAAAERQRVEAEAAAAVEQQRQAEAAAAAEQQRQAEAAAAAAAEQQRVAAERQRQAEAAAEQQRQAEAAAAAEQQRQAEAAAAAEQQRQAAAAEQQRQAAAAAAAEQQRQAEAAAAAEQQRQAEAAAAAEQQRQAEAAAAAEAARLAAPLPPSLTPDSALTYDPTLAYRDNLPPAAPLPPALEVQLPSAPTVEAPPPPAQPVFTTPEWMTQSSWNQMQEDLRAAMERPPAVVEQQAPVSMPAPQFMTNTAGNVRVADLAGSFQQGFNAPRSTYAPVMDYELGKGNLLQSLLREGRAAGGPGWMPPSMGKTPDGLDLPSNTPHLAPTPYGPRVQGPVLGPGTDTSDNIAAALSPNEFVFTADAVRGAGNGDVNQGIKAMYDLMHRLERRAGGRA